MGTRAASQVLLAHARQPCERYRHEMPSWASTGAWDCSTRLVTSGCLSTRTCPPILAFRALAFLGERWRLSVLLLTRRLHVLFLVRDLSLVLGLRVREVVGLAVLLLDAMIPGSLSAWWM